MGDERVRDYMSNIVGNRAVCEKLCLDVLANKLSHALILEGPQGTGKHTIAKSVAATLACAEKNTSDKIPCGTCLGCRKVFEDKSPDVITVNRGDKSTLGIDVIRFLREDVRTVPNDLDFKIYVIEEADKMTTEAQNAFLLTLEEPPSYAVFILLCESSSALLETIRSRAPVLRTALISNEALDTYISSTDRRAAQMKLSSPKEYAELIVASAGGIGTALKYLEPNKFAPVKEMRALVTDFCEAALCQKGAKAAMQVLSRFSQNRETLSNQLAMLSSASSDLLLLKKSDDAPLKFFHDRNAAIELCDNASTKFIYDLNFAVLTASNSNQRNANVRLLLTKLLSDAGMI